MKIALAMTTDVTSFSMHFEKLRRGLLWEAFCNEGEGSSGCKRGGKGRVSVLEKEVNTAGVLLNEKERSADNSVIFLL